MITLKTNIGDIFIELDEENAPKNCENFKKYYEEGHFEVTIFHRVIDNFMIKGGGFHFGIFILYTSDAAYDKRI